MAENPAQAAAAGVLEDVANDEEVMLQHQELDGEIFGTPAPLIAEPLIPQEQANVATDEVEQPDNELEIPEITWETPEDLQELLNAPDFDDEDDEPVQTYQEPQQQYEEAYEDPEKEALRRQLAKLQKKAEWAEEQKVKASRKNWEAEARKYFQFSNPDLIEAKSRRAFLKQAQAQHEAVAKVAKPVFDQLAELKAKAKAEALAEAREEAAQRWGRPTSGPQAANNIETTQSMKRERLEMGQSLTTRLKEQFRRGEVNL